MAVPTRSCIVCRKREDWTDLLRVVAVSDQVIPDPEHKLPGRGAWLHGKCFPKAVERNSFARAFRVNEVLQTEQLKQYLNN